MARALRTALAVAAITALLIALLLEIGLRLFLPQSAPGLEGSDPYTGLFVNDPRTAYRNAPDAHVAHRTVEIDTTYATNGQGLREDQPIGAPAPGTVRLLAVGDSFTFGWGVSAEAAYPRLLNGARAAGGGLVESINAGVMGYGTDNEAAWLQTYGWALRPQIVLVGFFTGNDVSDVIAGLHKSTVDATGRLVAVTRAGAPSGPDAATPADAAGSGPLGTVKTWLAHHSHAYVFLRALAHRLAHPAADPAQDGSYGEATLLRNPEPPAVAAGWAKTLAILDAMRADARLHGAILVVVAIPTARQVQDAAWAQVPAILGVAPGAVERDHPQRRLAAWSARSGVPVIDLLPGFRAAPAAPALYFRTDLHWTAAGHTLAARLIRAALARLGLFRS